MNMSPRSAPAVEGRGEAARLLKDMVQAQRLGAAQSLLSSRWSIQIGLPHCTSWRAPPQTGAAAKVQAPLFNIYGEDVVLQAGRR